MEHTSTIKRDRLYVGELVIPQEYQLNNNGKIVVSVYETCRNILFSLDDEMGTDVLYESPQYPVVNITNPPKYIDSKAVIKDAICLDELLKYFGYQEELTEKDLYKIRQTFFTGEFGLNNAKLFGYEEITDDVFSKGLGIRMVKYVGNGILSSEYYFLLDKKGNNSVEDYLRGYAENIDSFAPIKKEGLSRALRKY